MKYLCWYEFFSLCIFKAAPVWVAKPQDSHLEEGKPGYLHCYAQANPEPEVTWFRNNMMITPEVRYHTLTHTHTLVECLFSDMLMETLIIALFFVK